MIKNNVPVKDIGNEQNIKDHIYEQNNVQSLQKNDTHQQLDPEIAALTPNGMLPFPGEDKIGNEDTLIPSVPNIITPGERNTLIFPGEQEREGNSPIKAQSTAEANEGTSDQREEFKKKGEAMQNKPLLQDKVPKTSSKLSNGNSKFDLNLYYAMQNPERRAYEQEFSRCQNLKMKKRFPKKKAKQTQPT